MHSPGILETSLGIFSIFSRINRQPEEESGLFLKQNCWEDILCNLNAIHKTTCAFDADETTLASKPLIEILLISCSVLLLITTDGCHFIMSNCTTKKSK